MGVRTGVIVYLGSLLRLSAMSSSVINRSHALKEKDIPATPVANGIKKEPISLSKLPLRKKLTNLAWKNLPFSALADWQKDNEFIHGSYRPAMFSFRGCFKSMFRLHNETWNIWTHLVGFVFFVVLVMGVYVFGDYITGLFEEGITIGDLPRNEQFMLCLFFGGAIVCMLFSTLFHTLHNHSKNVRLFFLRLDLSGIAILITGSSIPAYYYGFYCTWKAQYIYIGVLIVLGVGCLILSMWSKFNSPRYRVVRYLVFVFFGLSGVIPSVHIYLRDGYALARRAYAMWGIIIMAATYIGGGALYAFRIPERFWPGKFDVWASSHQIFHVCVFTAALVHYNALLQMVKYRLDAGSCINSIPTIMTV